MFRRVAFVLPVFALACAPAWADDDAVLVTWEGSRLTRNDYLAAIQQVPERDRDEFQRDMKRITSVLDGAMVTRTLAERAKRAGLDKDPLVAREIEIASERVLARHWVEDFEKNLTQKDFSAAAEERYKTHREEYQIPEQVRASHILVMTRNRTHDEAKALAETLRARALAGEDFKALVKEYSEDPSAERNGGDLGLFGRNRMVKPFEEAAFALRTPGQIAPVVESQFGFHVIRLEERVEAKMKPFEEVKDQIVKSLRDKYVSDQRAMMISKIQNDPSIKMNTEAIDALRKP